MHVLIVKTSSLGDIVHTLPAVTDARRALPFVKFDWVAEEAFAEIPGWHPAVGNVIPVALRRWRKAKLATACNGEWRKFKQRLRERKIRSGNRCAGPGLKARLIARRVPARPSSDSIKIRRREPLASWCYRRKVAVLVGISSMRSNACAGYSHRRSNILLPELDRRLRPRQKSLHRYRARRNRHVLFLHGTTRADKHWPEVYWLQLCQQVCDAGFRVLLPWGNAVEHARAQRIAKVAPNTEVLPRQNLHSLRPRVHSPPVAQWLLSIPGSATSAPRSIFPQLHCTARPIPPVSAPTAVIKSTSAHAIYQPIRSAVVEPAIMAPLTPPLVWHALQPLLPTTP